MLDDKVVIAFVEDGEGNINAFFREDVTDETAITMLEGFIKMLKEDKNVKSN